MALSRVDRVGSFAFYSRILVLLMQVFFNSLMPDHNPKVFTPPSRHQDSGYDNLMHTMLDGLRRWDGVYFMHIAEHGYTYENTLVFFPFYPLVTRFVANTIFFPLQYLLNYTNVLLISGTAINLVAFIYAAKALYSLSWKVFENETLAYRAAQLFCINPASIFFTAAYSESCFALLSFSGMLKVELGENIAAAIYIGLSGLTRSNGIVSLGYILYSKFHKCMAELRQIVKNEEAGIFMLLKIMRHGIQFVVKDVLALVFLCLLPFLLYQTYCYLAYCGVLQPNYMQPAAHIVDYGNQMKYHMPHHGISPWCYDKLPLSYSYVEHHHWDVGFLNYYEWKQAPNFLVATPMICLCLAAIIYYGRSNSAYCISLGLYQPQNPLYKKQEDPPERENADNNDFLNYRCYPYVVHMLVLIIVGVFFMHVQVITRIVASACPAFYWFIAHITLPKGQSQEENDNPHYERNGFTNSHHSYLHTFHDVQPVPNRSNDRGDDILEWDNQSLLKKFILTYFHLYLFVGTAAFSNFLPWT